MKRKTIQEIKQLLLQIDDPNDERLAAIKADDRLGVQKSLQQWARQRDVKRAQERKLQELMTFEHDLHKEGYRLIAGIDEVGRGPLAGPVVAAAVVLPDDFNIVGVNDSKKLSQKKREELYILIQEAAIDIGVGIVDQSVIDEINIYEATKLAMRYAIDDLTFGPEYLLIDAMKLPVEIPQQSLIKGDARSVSIAAASIIAKVSRDRLMTEYAQVFPGYGFEKNAGYGTKEHLEGLEKLGITPIHRKTFAPVKNYI